MTEDGEVEYFEVMLTHPVPIYVGADSEEVIVAAGRYTAALSEFANDDNGIAVITLSPPVSGVNYTVVLPNEYRRVDPLTLLAESAE